MPNSGWFYLTLQFEPTTLHPLCTLILIPFPSLRFPPSTDQTSGRPNSALFVCPFLFSAGMYFACYPSVTERYFSVHYVKRPLHLASPDPNHNLPSGQTPPLALCGVYGTTIDKNADRSSASGQINPELVIRSTM